MKNFNSQIRTTQPSLVSRPPVRNERLRSNFVTETSTPEVIVRRRGRPSKKFPNDNAGLSADQYQKLEKEISFASLQRFCADYSEELAGFFPSRQFLLSKGRSDLAALVKKLGGPEVLAHSLRLTWLPERERERHLQERVRESLERAMSPTHLRVGPAEVQRVIVNLLARGKVFLIEHSESSLETQAPFWRTFHVPLSPEAFASPSEGLQKVLLEAHRCHVMYRNHYVRVTAYDPISQTQLSSFVLFTPPAALAAPSPPSRGHPSRAVLF